MTSSTRSFTALGGEGLIEIDMDEEVRLSYESVKNVDVLDVSPEGAEIWYTAETAYNDRVARIENQIISRLRDRLATARNAQEMFRVFSKFNSLFVRPKVSHVVDPILISDSRCDPRVPGATDRLCQRRYPSTSTKVHRQLSQLRSISHVADARSASGVKCDHLGPPD